MIEDIQPNQTQFGSEPKYINLCFIHPYDIFVARTQNQNRKKLCRLLNKVPECLFANQLFFSYTLLLCTFQKKPNTLYLLISLFTFGLEILFARHCCATSYFESWSTLKLVEQLGSVLNTVTSVISDVLTNWPKW